MLLVMVGGFGNTISELFKLVSSKKILSLKIVLLSKYDVCLTIKLFEISTFLFNDTSSLKKVLLFILIVFSDR